MALLQETMVKVWGWAQSNLQVAQQVQKERFDQKLQECRLEERSMVLVKARVLGSSGEDPWMGVFPVVGR